MLSDPSVANPVPTERLKLAVMVGVELKGEGGSWTLQDSLAELGRLADTAGLQVVGETYQKLAHPDPATWIGKGKVKELSELLAATDAGTVLFDGELSPAQQNKLETALGGARVVDRTRLILEIFSQHASTREGKLQVELAQYQYLLPRLSRLHDGLAQQTGGAGAGPVGLRGPGETQLELDRRQIRGRIGTLKKALEEVRTQRNQHRRQRERAGMPVVALVGYTNAGKSSLLNALTGAGVLVQDKLFATLDPTVRRLDLPGGRESLLTDTVGFIRKLPHDLVAAFRATLEGIEEAALIVHVADCSHPHAVEQVVAVDGVLATLQTEGVPRLLVWNKVDLLEHRAPPAAPGYPTDRTVAISAKTGENLAELLRRVERLLAEGLIRLSLLVPYDRFDIIRLAYDQGKVLSREDTQKGVRLRVSVPAAVGQKMSPFKKDE